MASSNQIQTVDCGDWSRFFKIVEPMDGWIFRGHASADWALRSTLDRFAPKGERVRAESSSLAEFKRRAHNYLEAPSIPANDGEWLALMQHFGAPTRLLDFTSSPFVAAYFALEDEPKSGSSDRAAVWAVRRSWCQDSAGRIAIEGDGFLGVSRAELEAVLSRLQPSRKDDLYRTVSAGVVAELLVRERALATARPFAVVLEPDRLSERMAAQQGLFLWPADVESSVEDNLTAMGDLGDGVRKILIPAEERPRALAQLRLMNITRTSLFPGLEGFAQSFRQFHVRESQDRYVLRTALAGSPWDKEGGSNDKR